MTLFVSPPIAAPWDFGIAFGRNGIFRILPLNIVQDFICSISLVCQNVAVGNIHMGEYIHCYGRIVDVSCGQLKIKWIAETVDNSMNFGRLTATAGADKLIPFAIYSPFLAPALCWCAFTLVESNDRFSISASTLSA